MADKYKATVIIAFYKRLDFLEKIFEGLRNQSLMGFEVVVAEDDNSLMTGDFLSGIGQGLPFPVKHVSHEDKGFRKNKILNDALKLAESEIILFLDGDCIPHRHFVKQYCRHITRGTAYFGRRVMLGERFTRKFLSNKGIRSLHFLSLLFSDSKKVEECLYLPWYSGTKNEYRGIWGCNWGVSRQDIFDVNGFDEDYIQASVGEDNDIEWRLSLHGIRFSPAKHKAIVFHMYHKENYNYDATLSNLALFEEKKALLRVRCLNGLIKNIS